jgi:diguanylate cyclase (GGDEF)-like protein/PAS domain S-box-containing protein
MRSEMLERLRVLMSAVQPDDARRIEQLLNEAIETGRLPALQVTFEAGPAAVEGAPWDAVFLNLAVPEDWHSLAEIHQAQPDLPVIVGVNAAEESQALLALSRGAVNYWLKDACAARDLAAIFRQVLSSVQLRSSLRRERWLEENISEVVWRARPDLRMLDVSASVQHLAGFSVQEALGMSLPDFIAPEARPALLAALQSSLLSQPAATARRELILELEHLNKNCDNFWAELHLRVETDAQGQAIGLQGLTSDVTLRHNLQQQINYVTLRDPLTGLFNRVYFEEELNRLECSRFYPITLLIANFEGLGEINTLHGLAAGDAMLKRVTSLLHTAFRAEDVISRLSGNDFVVVMPRANQRAAGRALQRVLNLVKSYNQDAPEMPLDIRMDIATAESGQSVLATYKAMLAEKAQKKAAV